MDGLLPKLYLLRLFVELSRIKVEKVGFGLTERLCNIICDDTER